ncbi:hypothetical protein EVAR_52717_1 [Eumeta japonica]|uniref:Uncharacterized protein n=1 Tax=Eumeta variegata TaxID=151549 RepID=A0A4C1ZC21_EUMVA|nr:hypothetical protein EVAR_52717_1 [Eumeta japonica]
MDRRAGAPPPAPRAAPVAFVLGGPPARANHSLRRPNGGRRIIVTFRRQIAARAVIYSFGVCCRGGKVAMSTSWTKGCMENSTYENAFRMRLILQRFYSAWDVFVDAHANGFSAMRPKATTTPHLSSAITGG